MNRIEIGILDEFLADLIEDSKSYGITEIARASLISRYLEKLVDNLTLGIIKKGDIENVYDDKPIKNSGELFTDTQQTILNEELFININNLKNGSILLENEIKKIIRTDFDIPELSYENQLKKGTATTLYFRLPEVNIYNRTFPFNYLVVVSYLWIDDRTIISKYNNKRTIELLIDLYGEETLNTNFRQRDYLLIDLSYYLGGGESICHPHASAGIFCLDTQHRRELSDSFKKKESESFLRKTILSIATYTPKIAHIPDIEGSPICPQCFEHSTSLHKCIRCSSEGCKNDVALSGGVVARGCLTECDECKNLLCTNCQISIQSLGRDYRIICFSCKSKIEDNLDCMFTCESCNNLKISLSNPVFCKITGKRLCKDCIIWDKTNNIAIDSHMKNPTSHAYISQCDICLANTYKDYLTDCEYSIKMASYKYYTVTGCLRKVCTECLYRNKTFYKSSLYRNINMLVCEKCTQDARLL